MGFVIWYRVQFPGAGIGGLPLRISNDVFGGEYILDADIVLQGVAGTIPGSFRVCLQNLPADAAEGLKGKHLEELVRGGQLTATIELGYFDEPAGQAVAMTGAVTSVHTRVDQAGLLLTEVSGLELAGYRLTAGPVESHRPGPVPLASFVQDVGDRAEVKVEVLGDLGTVEDYTLKAATGLEALRLLARQAGAPVVIVDETILFGAAVGISGPAIFAAGVNIVSLHRHQEEERPLAPPTGPPPAPDAAAPKPTRSSLDLTVLGDPSLRVGQAATLVVLDPRDAILGPLRVERLVHRFSTSAGYTCDVTVVVADPGQPARRAVGVHGVVDRVRNLVETVSSERAGIDVGEVAAYQAGADGLHLADLRYGQPDLPDAVAPSVEGEIAEEPMLHAKPFVSPFAWDRCGLVVPVYPTMRAVLVHNGGLVNDALVSGFVWAETTGPPPKNEPGDFWLCLPTGLDGQGAPTGAGVNDLTDQSGLRVIQAKGLKIQVADGDLPAVGDRPEVPSDLPSTLVIEHEAGTTITVDADGAVTILTDQQDITLSNGQASIVITGGSVKLQASAVEVAAP